MKSNIPLTHFGI